MPAKFEFHSFSAGNDAVGSVDADHEHDDQVDDEDESEDEADYRNSF